VSDKTSESSANYVLLTRLADEFAARYRAGERPSLQEYIDRHPALADDIRELFPAMVEIEQAGEDHHEAAEQAAAPVAPALQQLGDFRIIREVAKGGMGIVYEAEQVSLGRHVALKVLPRSMLIDAKAKRRFEREAKSAAKLHHTNIVPVFGVGEQDGLPYYIMQFIQGLGLDDVLEELKKLQPGNTKIGTFIGGELRVSRTVGQVSNLPGEERQVKNLPHGAPSAVHVARSLLTGEFRGTMDHGNEEVAAKAEAEPKDPGADVPSSPALSDSFTLSSSSVVLPGPSRDGSKSKNKKQTYWQSVASIGVQVAEALEYAHKQGIHHRDIKPSNLLLDTQGTVWVTDFGLAKADDHQNLTHTGDILGTLRYMPPEAFEGKTDARSDVYSLGLTLYEMLAFRPAFDEKERNRLIKQVTHEEPARLGKLNRQVPQDIETIVHKAIDKDSSQRYATAGELAEDLQRFIEDEPIKARRASQTERLRRWCRRNPALASAAGLAAAALLAVTIISIFFAAHQAQSNEDLRQEQDRTKAALNKSEQLSVELDSKLTELRKNSALAAVERGQSLIEQGQLHGGLLWLTRGLELAPAEQRDLQHAIRTSLAGFRADIPILRATFSPSFSVVTASISPDGKTIAYGGIDHSSSQGRAELWDLARGKRVGPVLEHQKAVYSVAFSPDGKTLVTGSLDQTARLWDAATGRPLNTPSLQHQGAVIAASFSPDGKTFVTAGTGDFIRLWDAATWQPLPQKLRQLGEVLAVAFSPDSKSLLIGVPGKTSEGMCRLWDLATGQARSFRRAQAVFAVAFSPDGKTFATGGLDTTVRLWDVATGESVGKTLEHQAPVYALAFSPDGRVLLSAGGGVVRLWDVDTGVSRGERLEGAYSSLSARFSSDGQSFLIPGPMQTIRLWSLPAGRQTRAPLPQGGAVSRLDYSRDGKILLVESSDRLNAEVRLWDPTAGKPLGPSLRNPGLDHPVALAPDGRTIVMGAGSDLTSGFRFWDAIAGKTIGEPIPFSGRRSAVAFSQDGKTILLGGYDENLKRGLAQLVDAAGGKIIVPSLVQPGLIRSAAFSSDGKTVMTASREFFTQAGEVHLWDARTGKTIGSSLQHQASVLALAFSPNDKIILSAGDDRAAYLWDVATGKPIGVPLLHQGKITAVAFSPDGKIAATASDDKTARLWNVPTGLPLGPPLRHQRAVNTLAFDAEGRTLLTGGADKMVRFWRVPLPLPDEVEQIKAAVEVAGGMTLSPEGVTNNLEAPGWQARLEKWASGRRQPLDRASPFDPLPGEGLSWHQHQALDSLEAENWQAALWHLDRRIRLQPDDSLSHVLRTKANLQLDRLDQAEADLARAFDLGPAEQVLSWYRIYAAERADKEQWQAALWYLDRLIDRRPKDAALCVQRARASSKRNRWKEAAADYARAVALSRKEPQLWLEKAEFDSKHCQWQDAANAYDKLLNLDPGDVWRWFHSAAVHLYIGDKDGYRRHCREMLKRFGQSDDPQIADLTAKTCLLLPDAVEDQKLVQKLADRAVTNTEKNNIYYWFMLVKGMAEYRAGNPEQAIDWLGKSLTPLPSSVPEFNSLAQLFLSMSYHRLGREKEARQALQQARTLINAELEKWKRENASKNSDDSHDWDDWLRSMSVLPEAEALIEGKKNR
jgi:WD40 repeat protein/tetratricopeptide (TPR) repeat protein